MKSIITALLITSLLGAPTAIAQTLAPPDDAVALGTRIPDVVLQDDAGSPTRVLDTPGIPMVISPVFTECPHVCGRITENLRDALAPIEGLGERYNVLTLTFDPNDSAEDLHTYRSTHTLPQRWRLARGDSTQIDSVLSAMDYRILALDGGGYAHANAAVIVDGRGEVSGFIHGIDYNTEELRRALATAWARESIMVRFRGLIIGVVVVAMLTLVLTIVLTSNRSQDVSADA